ncbi:DUF1127 domain-containing protein [Jiella pelagia]|uniref:DUF1127 domain-containing protein n=1 Tax=Jiella pelagia TaxID=2986949 RepID=A0ABY7C3K9_9HYPH|nr:DUF1127 domain-containing protein [Jiella pelagia]WAP70392.1 DUF1127 domain-containing protein [Jiella pelagia]
MDDTFDDEAVSRRPEFAVAGRGREWLGRLVRVLRRWAAMRRQRLDLASLSDWQLRDLGLTAEAALKEARKPFWQ